MLQLYTYTCRIHIDTMNKDERRLLEKNIPLTLLKGLCLWEGVGDRTELQHIDPHSYGHQCCVFLVLQRCSTGGLEALSAGCGFLYRILSLTHLISNSLGVPRAPSAGWWLYLPHLFSNLSELQLTDFLSSPSYIIVQSPTQSLEWHVWSSSSGNNCHAVHRSLSSDASVYECTIGFYLVPYCQPSPPTRFLLITAIGMCHFLPVHHFGMACLAGSKVNIQQKLSKLPLKRFINVNIFVCCPDF